MYERTIDQAITNTFGPRADEALESLRCSLDAANAKLERTSNAVLDHMEIATYLVAGAIVIGFITAAVIIRTTAGS